MFFALNVTVKNATLQDSLDQYVKGELLEGDNAYFCEKCGEKVCYLLILLLSPCCEMLSLHYVVYEIIFLFVEEYHQANVYKDITTSAGYATEEIRL